MNKIEESISNPLGYYLDKLPQHLNKKNSVIQLLQDPKMRNAISVQYCNFLNSKFPDSSILSEYNNFSNFEFDISTPLFINLAKAIKDYAFVMVYRQRSKAVVISSEIQANHDLIKNFLAALEKETKKNRKHRLLTNGIKFYVHLFSIEYHQRMTLDHLSNLLPTSQLATEELIFAAASTSEHAKNIQSIAHNKIAFKNIPTFTDEQKERFISNNKFTHYEILQKDEPQQDAIEPIKKINILQKIFRYIKTNPKKISIGIVIGGGIGIAAVFIWPVLVPTLLGTAVTATIFGVAGACLGGSLTVGGQKIYDKFSEPIPTEILVIPRKKLRGLNTNSVNSLLSHAKNKHSKTKTLTSKNPQQKPLNTSTIEENHQVITKKCGDEVPTTKEPSIPTLVY